MLIFSLLEKFSAGLLLLPRKLHAVLVSRLCRTRFGRVHIVMSLQRMVSCFVTRLCLMLAAALAFSACLPRLQEQNLS